MKNIFLISLLLLLFSTCYSQLDTSHRVPGLTQYWDYVTNGNNLRKLWVLGDTVIVACDYTDSLNAQVTTARRIMYQFSFNRGLTWQSDAIEISPTYKAYPDISPIIFSGSRSIAISGGGRIDSYAGGFVGVDVVLGAGAFTITGIQNTSPIVSSPLSSLVLACAYANFDTLFYRSFNCSTNSFSAPAIISTLSQNARYYITTGLNGSHVLVMWWDGAASMLKARESSNSGNSFGSTFIVAQNTVINGSQVTPWYTADAVYKPNSDTFFVAYSTLAPGFLPTAGGSKVVLWSPSLNGGQPVRIADWSNMPQSAMISDTAYFNSHLQNIQVGITPISSPTIAFTENGARLTCVFSSIRRDVSSYGFHYNSCFFTYSDDNGLNWQEPRSIHVPIPGNNLIDENDEIYPSISKKSNSMFQFHVTYSLSKFPGCASFGNNNTPISKNYQIYLAVFYGGLPGIKIISGEIPAEFSLQQNYPNPFNPQTKIKFDVPLLRGVDAEGRQGVLIKIIVYDLLGRELQTLVNEELKPGTYEIEWNAGNYSSGIYYYKLMTKDFVQTRKMVYLK